MEHGNAALQIHQENHDNQIQPFASRESFGLALQMANELSRSSLVPTDFRGEQGRANCLIALEVAGRLGISPFMTMQNMHVIHGRPSFSATFLIGMINASGRFTPLQYKTSDEKGGTCVAYAKDRRTDEVLEGPAVSMEMAHAEGWASKNGSKWKTMPELMLRYRAATLFARTFCPEMALGLRTEDEVYDIGPSAYGADDTTSRTRKINVDLLGKSADVIDINTAQSLQEDATALAPAQSRTETEVDVSHSSVSAPEARSSRADVEKARKVAVKEIIAEFKDFFGAIDLAQGEMVRFIGKANSKDWDEGDIEALRERLDSLKMQPLTDHSSTSSDPAPEDAPGEVDDEALAAAEEELAAFL